MCNLYLKNTQVFSYIKIINKQMRTTIKINNEDYKIKQTLRALFIFEQITKKPFKIETLLDNYVYLYSVILANNNDKILDWNDFINALDEDNSIYEQLMEILNESKKVEELLDGVSEDNGEEQKKS